MSRQEWVEREGDVRQPQAPVSPGENLERQSLFSPFPQYPFTPLSPKGKCGQPGLAGPASDTELSSLLLPETNQPFPCLRPSCFPHYERAGDHECYLVFKKVLKGITGSKGHTFPEVIGTQGIPKCLPSPHGHASL